MQEHVIETLELTKYFGKKCALNDVSLTIPRGGVHAIVGSNGAGKSTLFRLLLGLQTPTSGSARVLGESSTALSPQTRGRVGFVNEEHTLPGWMTADQLVQMQRALYRDWDEASYRQAIGHFDVAPERRIASLSRGERAGLNLALALAQRPQLLILDEPTLGLDVVAKQRLLETLLFTGAAPDTTIVYCSHQMEEIERVADSLIVMERGRPCIVSTPDDFCERFTAWAASLPEGAATADLPGLLTIKEIEGQHHMTVLDRGESFRADLEGLGAEAIHARPVNLELAVNAFLSRQREPSQFTT